MRNGRGNNQNGRNRRMYEMTGVPGWIRFGSSPGYTDGSRDMAPGFAGRGMGLGFAGRGRGMGPGFAGRGRGMGPCAAYLQKTGQMEKFVEDYATGNPSAKYWQQAFQDIQDSNPNFEKEMISNQIDDLEAEIKELKHKLKQLR